MNAIGFVRLAIFLLSYTSIASLHGADDRAQLVFPALVRSIEAADAANPALAAELRVARGEFSALVESLEKLPNGTPENYQPVFDAYAQALKKVTANVESAEARNLTRAMIEDLGIKNKFISGGFGFRVRNSTQVLVRVKTLSSAGKPLTGYQVSCNPRRFADAVPALFNFGTLTPTEMNLPPGVYTLLVTRLDRPIASRDISVGMSGKRLEEVHVAVPAAGRQ